jgi:hypothetical protein
MKLNLFSLSQIKNLNFLTKFIFLLIVFISLQNIVIACCPPSECQYDGYNQVKKKKTIQRTFYNSNDLSTKIGQFSVNQNLKTPENIKTDALEITYSDLIQTYNPINTLQFSWTEEGSYQMNIGIVDLENPQTWTMPNFPLITVPFGEGVPLSETPYLGDFPTATHCRLYKYLEEFDGNFYEEFFYEFYQFSENGVLLMGVIDTIPELEWVEKSFNNEYMATLPLNINTDLATSDTILWHDTTYIVDIHIITEGFGTLITPAGNVEVLKIRNEYNEKSYDENNILLDEFQIIAYTFYSKFGHRLSVYLTEGSATTNVVDIDEVESEIVIFNPNSIPTNQETKKILFYPNPSNGIIKFSETGDYDIYYINGVVLKSYHNVSEIDVSGLTKGTYLIKQQNGQSQMLILK